MKNRNWYEKKNVSGSEAVILSLLAEKTELLFGYVGGAIMPVYDALYDYIDNLNHILTRHEQGSVHAAQAYARASGKTGVCFATSGPGATNLITGLADALMDSTPIVCITGQVNSKFLGSDAFQETDIISVSAPVTKWNFQVTSAKEIPEAISKAFYIAKNGRPGPVLIDITKDAQQELFDFEYKSTDFIRTYLPFPVKNDLLISDAVNVINNSKKPLIIAGHGVLISDASKELADFVEKANIPVATTLLGMSAMPADHPLYFGMVGMHGNYGPNINTNNADVIIAIGMRFDDRITSNPQKYASQAKIIHIEIDKSEINKNIKADYPLCGDAKEIIQEMLKNVKFKERAQWIRSFRDCYDIEFEKVINNQTKPYSGAIHMAEVINTISEITKGEALIVTDVGQNQMFAARYYQFNKPNSFISSGGLGTMGFGLPASIGAKLGAPERDVILIVGDGGLQMTIQEFATIVQNNLNIKIVLLNNEFLGMVRQWQEMFFQRRYSYTEMSNPNFTAIASAYGIESKKITQRDELADGINLMLKSNNCFFLEVQVGKELNVLPMIPAGESVSNILLTYEN
ncbi:MAG: biosynthetic-type acetolactate synthase large subunit [Bacteroidales bacterium]|nr:biosynthetic-type acetolactate synthase large subunit [Bacteroidales bacterium]